MNETWSEIRGYASNSRTPDRPSQQDNVGGYHVVSSLKARAFKPQKKVNLILKIPYHLCTCTPGEKMIVLKKYSHRSTPITEGISVGGGISVGCGSKSNSRIASVEDSVESLEPSLPIDEVESRSEVAAKVIDNQVNVAGNTANVSVKATRPDLSVGSECE